MSGEGVPLVIFQRRRTAPSFPLTPIEQWQRAALRRVTASVSPDIGE